jgi:hypothetical protein
MPGTAPDQSGSGGHGYSSASETGEAAPRSLTERAAYSAAASGPILLVIAIGSSGAF